MSSNWVLKPPKQLKKNCYAKGENKKYHNTVTRSFKKFCLSCKNLDDQARLGRSENCGFKEVLQIIETNLRSSIRGVSGELGISQSSVVHHLHDLCKSIQRCLIVPYMTEILQNFWLTLVCFRFAGQRTACLF